MNKHVLSDGIQRWEHQEILIPLDISLIHWWHPDYVAAAALRVQPMIAAALTEARHSGWHADEPTDFATLFSRSQVRTRNSVLRWHVDSVTIRLLRPIWNEYLVPHG
ncbi:MAG: hypothetical protein ACLQUY_14205 [Ktedonobacterales bacterium]